jgi:hypothetical protein
VFGQRGLLPVLLQLLVGGRDLVVHFLAGLVTGVAGLRLRGVQLFFGLRSAGLRLGVKVAGLGQELGAPPQCLAPPGEVIVGEEPSGDPIEGTEEPLKAQAKGRLIVPVAGNDMVFQEGEGQAHGRVFQLAHAAGDGGKTHNDLLSVLVDVRFAPAIRT